MSPRKRHLPAGIVHGHDAVIERDARFLRFQPCHPAFERVKIKAFDEACGLRPKRKRQAANRHQMGGMDDGKGGAPYILHPLRMMMALASTDERIVAVLHDVCEDCPGWTLDRLRAEGFSDHIIAALDSVTKREGEDYEAFVSRAVSDPIGRKVKLADLTDNCDLSRIAAPSEADHQRIEKYRRAIKLIQSL
jgi:(p)ppGpp synthase/HD superfamily hydrolase